jgi:hypothetical protein
MKTPKHLLQQKFGLWCILYRCCLAAHQYWLGVKRQLQRGFAVILTSIC